MNGPRPTFNAIRAYFVNLTQEVLFGDVWEQPSISKRDRGLITVATLIALYRAYQLRAVSGGPWRT